MAVPWTRSWSVLLAVLLVVGVFASVVTGQEDGANDGGGGEDGSSTVSEREWVMCWSCGPGKECPLPWAEEGTLRLNCTSGSCMKFDGWTEKDNKRVVMRDCGYFKAEECSEEEFLMDGVTPGRLCHCMADDCNGVNDVKASFTFVLMAAIAVLFILWAQM